MVAAQSPTLRAIASLGLKLMSSHSPMSSKNAQLAAPISNLSSRSATTLLAPDTLVIGAHEQKASMMANTTSWTVPPMASLSKHYLATSSRL